MNKVLYVLFAVVLFSCTEKQEAAFTVEGTLKNSQATTVYLEENPGEGQPIIIDSAKPGNDGKFTLDAQTKEQSMFSLRTDKDVFPFAILINDSKKVTVEADQANQTNPYSVNGSEASQGLIDFDKTLNQRFENYFKAVREIDSLGKISNTNPADKKIIDSITNLRFSEYETIVEGIKTYAREFIDKSNSPVLTLYAFGSYQTKATQYGLGGFSKPETAEIITKAAAKFPDHTVLNEQKKKIKPNIAPDFTVPDVNGNPVALSSFKGKYVLVDFWASWCAPCRKENPNIVAAYNQFKDKNFTILGVSLDKSKEPWLKAIQDDGLAWNHVSDLKYWSSEAAALYGVRSIPYNVLVDPNGNVVAENLHGKELQNVLSKFLK